MDYVREYPATIEEWLGKNNKIGIDIWNKKYRYKNESFPRWVERVANGDEKIKKLIYHRKFLPAGRVLTNIGTDDKSSVLFNCYSSGYAEDSYEQLLELNKRIGLTYKAQGGQGISMSKIRPKGTSIGGRFNSDGIVPFMEIFNTTTYATQQGGARKGALMISLDIRHKEAETFIKIKSELGKIENANLSLEIDDEFMNCVRAYYSTGEHRILHERKVYAGDSDHPQVIEYDVDPIALYKLMIKTAYDWGEPGCIFTQRFRNYNLMEYDNDYQIVTSNPCLHPDTLVQTVDGEIKIKDIKKPTMVYCMDENQNVTTALASPAFKTRENAELIKLTFNTGKFIKLTTNHLVYIQDEGWIEAGKLTVGQIPVALFRNEANEYKLTDSNFTPKIIKIGKVENSDVYDLTVERYHNFIASGIVVHNCGEQPLPKDFPCNLGSMNLAEYVLNPFTADAEFDFKRFNEDVWYCSDYLDNIIDISADRHPLKEQRENSLNYRNIGLGVFGYADMLFELGLIYGSKEAKRFTDVLFKEMFVSALQSNIDRAIKKGAFPAYKTNMPISNIVKKHNIVEIPALRNCSMLSIAPTGSIATMLGRSGGTEPEFAISYTRKTVSLSGEGDKYYKVYCMTAQDYLDATGEKELPDYFVASADIHWQNRLETQAIIQNHIDTAISSTVNLPNQTSVEDIENLYLKAWELGLKGITIFRDGCARIGILTTDSPKKEEDKKEADTVKFDSITPVSRRGMGTTSGKTYCKKCACGTLYITINTDEDGHIVETFVHTSKGGACQANLNGVNRMISSSLRSGVKVTEIIDCLTGINCPACANLKGKGVELDGISCPDIIGRTIKEFYNGPQVVIKNPVVSEQPEKITNKERCPECGEPLTHEGGCVSCTNCGWSRCG